MASNILINGGSGNDYILNGSVNRGCDFIAINGNEGIDNIFNTGSYVTISGGNTVIFENVTQNDTFNINGKVHTVMKSKSYLTALK